MRGSNEWKPLLFCLSHESRRKQGAKDVLLSLSLMMIRNVIHQNWGETMNECLSFIWVEGQEQHEVMCEREGTRRTSFPKLMSETNVVTSTWTLCPVSWCLSQISGLLTPSHNGLTESWESLSSRTKRTVHTKEESMCYTEANSVLSPLFLSKVCLHFKPLQRDHCRPCRDHYHVVCVDKSAADSCTRNDIIDGA